MTTALEHQLRLSLTRPETPMPDTYDQIQAVSISRLRAMAVSPLQYRHELEVGRPDTAALLFGRAVHLCVLEPRRFANEVTVFAGDKRTKAWKEFKAAHEGWTILAADEFDRCQAIASAIKAHPASRELFDYGAPEVELEWTDEKTGLRCKGRLDYMRDSAILDLKTTARIERFGASAASYDYHVQAAWYVDGLRAARDEERPYLIVAVGSHAPHDVAVYRVTDDVLALGRRRYRAWLDRLAEEFERDEWPGIAPTVQDLTLPAWAWTDDEPLELTIGGQQEVF